jgi:hypothetical protein
VQAPSAPPSSAAPPAEPTRCRRRSEVAVSLEAAPSALNEPAPSEDEEDDELLPFGVDIGAARSTRFGFAVSGIRGQGRAFVTLLGERGAQQVDLGELHGDAETPAIAAVGEQLIVVLRSTDAAGYTLKLGSLALPQGSAVVWGSELSKLGKSVTGVELAADAAHGVVVYQSEARGSSRLMLGHFATQDLGQPLTVKPVEAKDAEMPRLVPRPGGFWLSWVRTLSEPKKSAVSSGGRPEQDPEERELLDVGLRVIEVAKLDEQGAEIGSALRVGEPRRQVLLYDVAPASGGLLVAARSDSAAPGAEGGAILLSRVGPDGSIVTERMDDDELGSGAPTLLFDESATERAPWLAVSAPSDTTRLGLWQGRSTSLSTDPLIGHAEVIAVSGERFLLQRARGRAVTLETLDCSFVTEAPAEIQK